jgi:hypothetical protein
MPRRTDLKKILLIGSGPIVIGQAREFDYSGTQACKALREEGYEVVLVNSNPATIMTDPETADRTYIEPITWEMVARVIERERPDALLPTLGGQTALNTAMDLHRHGVLKRFNVEMIGATPEVIEKTEDREKFKQAMIRIGVAVVPQNFQGHGVLHPGDILVSNFNNNNLLQGTGTTIVRIDSSGKSSTFFQGQSGLGLTAGLAVLKSGFVIVGNMPTTDGTSNTVQAGSLLIMDRNGNLVSTITDPKYIDGPWDLTVNDQGNTFQVFVSNVLSGTVTRVLFNIENGVPVPINGVKLASHFGHRGDPNALEIGPAGLAYNPHTDTLYIASSLDNAIYAISGAAAAMMDQGKGHLVYQDPVHLHAPLGLVLAPNGDLITANSDAVDVSVYEPSELVEFTPTGKFVGQFSLDSVNGGAFNLAVFSSGGKLKLAAVDDDTNSLDVWTI